ncbi:unnamed protein product [Miscanthus lutarioriparius]|uniref:DUF4283 domain-containing protein n=1 Tax=Miscanthus lutarioriparius TaxID=422564 RepID=A0A811R4B7_9POAL|nr:unnamed protein product [Miscanthus lutarioriparius]
MALVEPKLQARGPEGREQRQLGSFGLGKPCCPPFLAVVRVPSPNATDRRAAVVAATNLPPLEVDAHPANTSTAVGEGHALEVGARNATAREVLQEQALEIHREHHRRLTEIDRPSIEVVVVPHSDEINATETTLSLALVTLVGGTRPSVMPAMVREHLWVGFGVNDAAMPVMRHAPEDFIVRFSHRVDLERVLAATSDGLAPFMLTWHRWTRLSRAVTASFTFRVLVGIKGVPAHALSESIAQQLLGSSCAQVELASTEADGVDDDDYQGLFIAAWCLHPLLVPE